MPKIYLIKITSPELAKKIQENLISQGAYWPISGPRIYLGSISVLTFEPESKEIMMTEISIPQEVKTWESLGGKYLTDKEFLVLDLKL